MHSQWCLPCRVCIQHGWRWMYPRSSMTLWERRRGFIARLMKGEMIARKAVLQDVRVPGAQPAPKDRGLRSHPAIMRGDSNEPLFSSSLMTHHLLWMTRSSMTIPLGSSIFIAGKSKARALRKVVSQTSLMTRATDSLLPTSMSMPAPLLLQASGTAGNLPGMITDRDTPVRPIGRGFRAMTGRFSRKMYTSLDLVALNLLCNISLLLTSYNC